jgi:hypothetical protein
MPKKMKTQVMTMVQEHVYETYVGNRKESQQFEQEIEIWEASPKREIQERLTTEQVVEATAMIVEHTPEAELKMKLVDTHIKGMLADFGESLHLGKINGRYELLIEEDILSSEKGVSPIEFHKTDELGEIIEKITKRSVGE